MRFLKARLLLLSWFGSSFRTSKALYDRFVGAAKRSSA
jgi:hypothetical protein